MTKINLIRINHYEPEFDEFKRMLSELEAFLREDVKPEDLIWKTNLYNVMAFQDEDGSFKLVDSYEIPMDARVDFCHTPTYICTAILMKTFLTDEAILGETGKEILKKALEACTRIRVRGHGMEYFRQAGISEFILYHYSLCPRFCKIMKQEISHYSVFVYGTLMQGESNHDYYLRDSSCKGKATVSGFEMYDIGYFPGIVPGEGTVPGELFEVDEDTLQSLDGLEGEGSLYIRKPVQVTLETGEKVFASIYVYNGNTDGLEKIPAWRREDYVWYVSYGSNMLRERFLCYIKGGAFEAGGADHKPCDDPTEPLAVKAVEIPYDMYFGNNSPSWESKGVSFLDITRPGSAKGVAYLITRGQFEHVACQENGGCPPEGSINWYNTVVELGTLDGCDVVTITNDTVRPCNAPAAAYLDTLRRGLQENYPDITGNEIATYLKKATNRK